MEEKFRRIFSLAENLYCRDSPVIITAGHLLQNIENAELSVHFRFQNVSSKALKAIEIHIVPYDGQGNELAALSVYQQLRHVVENGHYFTEEGSILLPEPMARSFCVKKLCVLLDDGRYIETGENWETLPEPAWLKTALPREELIQQYRLETNDSAIYVPQQASGLWQCACGQWDMNNYGRSNPCSSCGIEKAVIFGTFSPRYLEEALLRREASPAPAGKSGKHYYDASTEAEFIFALAEFLDAPLFEFGVKYLDEVAKEEKFFAELIQCGFSDPIMKGLAGEYHSTIADQLHWLCKLSRAECSPDLAFEQWLYGLKDRLAILRAVYSDFKKSIPEKLLAKFSKLNDFETKIKMLEQVQSSLNRFFHLGLNSIDVDGDEACICYYNDTDYDFNLMLSFDFRSRGVPAGSLQSYYNGIYSKELNELRFHTDFPWDTVHIEWLFSFSGVAPRPHQQLTLNRGIRRWDLDE